MIRNVDFCINRAFVERMHKRGGYERRGNATERGVRQKVERFRPITAKEMKGAFEEWKQRQPDAPRTVSRNIIVGDAGNATDSDANRVNARRNNRRDKDSE